jgi:cytochrome P450
MACHRRVSHSALPPILAKGMDTSMDQVRLFQNLLIFWISFDVVYRYLHPDWSWYDGYDTYRELKSDVFLVASPGSLIAWVASPEVIAQITSRRNDFPKPTRFYRSLDIFGANVVSSEGMLWRQHRKITAPPFTEKNNQLVWVESLHQAQNMVRGWIGSDSKGNRVVTDVPEDTMRLSLHVISRAGFGVRLLWPGQETAGLSAEEKLAAGISSSEVPEGHTMSFKDSLSILLSSVLWIILLPMPVLSKFYTSTSSASL